MGFWWWVLVFGGISLAALCLYALLGLRLFRKAKVLFSELGRLGAAAATMQAALDARGPDAEPPWTPDPVAVGRHRAG